MQSLFLQLSRQLPTIYKIPPSRLPIGGDTRERLQAGAKLAPLAFRPALVRNIIV